MRSSQRIHGMHKWQMRWLELTPSRLSFWEVASDGTAEPRGALSFSDVVGVCNHTRSAHRIELRLRTGRTVHLCAPSAGDRKAWLDALQLALLDAASQRGSPAEPLDAMEAKCTGIGGIRLSVGLRSTGRTSIVELQETSSERRSDVSHVPAPQAPSPTCEGSEASRDLVERCSLDAEDDLIRKSSGADQAEVVPGPEATSWECEASEDTAGEHSPEGLEESEAAAATAQLLDEIAEDEQSEFSRSTRGSSSLSKSDSTFSSPNASPMHGSHSSSCFGSFAALKSTSSTPGVPEPHAHLCRAASRACVLFPELPGSREVELQVLGVAAFMSRIERSRQAAASRHESAVAAAA
jgi:hypothetical protein